MNSLLFLTVVNFYELSNGKYTYVRTLNADNYLGQPFTTTINVPDIAQDRRWLAGGRLYFEYGPLSRETVNVALN